MTIDLVLLLLCITGLLYSAVVWYMIGAIWCIVKKDQRPGKPSWLVKFVATNTVIVVDGWTVKAKSCMGITIDVIKAGSNPACHRIANDLAEEIAAWLTLTSHSRTEYIVTKKET